MSEGWSSRRLRTFLGAFGKGLQAVIAGRLGSSFDWEQADAARAEEGLGIFRPKSVHALLRLPRHAHCAVHSPCHAGAPQALISCHSRSCRAIDLASPRRPCCAWHPASLAPLKPSLATRHPCRALSPASSRRVCCMRHPATLAPLKPSSLATRAHAVRLLLPPPM